MNKIIIACVLAALMMTGGTLYAGENSDGSTETSAAVTRAGRGHAKRAAQKGELEKGRRGKSAGAGTARAEGRRQAAANLKAMDKNGDGSISKSEASGKIARHFGKIDSDGNGSLSQEELKAMRQHKGRNDGADSRPAAKRRGKAEKRPAGNAASD